MHYKKIIAIKVGKTNGIATIQGTNIEVYKYPNSVFDLKMLIKGIQHDRHTIIAIEPITLAGINYMPHMAQQARKAQFKNYQEILLMLIDLDIPFIEVSERTWVNYLGLSRPLDEKKEKDVRIGNACVQWFGGIVKVSRWNHRALLILRFMVLKLQTDPMWVEQKINNSNLNQQIDLT